MECRAQSTAPTPVASFPRESLVFASFTALWLLHVLRYNLISIVMQPSEWHIPLEVDPPAMKGKLCTQGFGQNKSTLGLDQDQICRSIQDYVAIGNLRRWPETTSASSWSMIRTLIYHD